MPTPSLWPWLPAGAVTERLEWLTDVLEADSGVEQRVRVRTYPRRFFEFDIVLSERDARTAENRLHGNLVAEWYLPIWMDAEPLSAAVSSGATTIPAITATRDYGAGRYVALISRTDPHNCEVRAVATVAADHMTLTTGTAQAWAAGSILVPIRTARLAAPPAFARFTGASLYGRLRWQCTDLTTYAEATETSYGGLPVLTAGSNWDSDPTREYSRASSLVDSGQGIPAWATIATAPSARQSHRWLADGRTEIDTLRKWLFARRGRQSCFWQPSGARDLELQVTVGAGDTTIDVQHCGYTANIAQANGRRDIRILLTNGTTYYRRVTGSSEVDTDTERLTISSALGASVAPADVAAISFMHLARLEADAIELAWHRWDVVETAFQTRGIGNDI